METNSRFRIPEFDVHLAQQFEEIREHIKINAQTFAQKNLPPLQSRKLNTYFEEDHLKYQALIDAVNKELQYKSACDTVVEHKAITEARLRNNNHKQVLVREKHIAYAAKLKGRRPPYGEWRVALVWVAVMLVNMFDGLLAIPIFEAFGYNLGESVGMGVLFGIMLAITAHSFPKMVLWGKTLWQRRAIAATLLVLLVAMFSFMAFHRAAYIEGQMADNGMGHVVVSPLPFVLLSTFLFLAAVALNYFYYPTEQQRDAMHEYLHDLKIKRDNEAEQAKHAAEQVAIENEHASVRQINAAKLVYGSMLESLIISNAHQGFAEWKKFNMLTRPDNGRPASFDDHEYPYNFVTNFHSVKLI